MRLTPMDAMEDPGMTHACTVIALALTLVWLSPGPAAAQDKSIEPKFSSWVGVGHGHHTGVLAPWAKMIEDKSGGRLKVTIYTLPAEERQRWATKLKPVEDEWLTSMQAKGLPGRQLLQDLREAIKRYDP
jgi:hypothetical protein